MNRLILEDLPPSVNHMYENKGISYRDKRGQLKRRLMRVLTPDAEAWYNSTVMITNVWRNKNKWRTANGKVIVRLWFFFPDNRRRDTHNGLKALLDAFEDAQIYKNDQTALPQVMDYQVDRKWPRLEIEFEEVIECKSSS